MDKSAANGVETEAEEVRYCMWDSGTEVGGRVWRWLVRVCCSVVLQCDLALSSRACQKHDNIPALRPTQTQTDCTDRGRSTYSINCPVVPLFCKISQNGSCQRGKSLCSGVLPGGHWPTHRWKPEAWNPVMTGKIDGKETRQPTSMMVNGSGSGTRSSHFLPRLPFPGLHQHLHSASLV